MIIIVFVLALFVFNEMKIAGKNEFFHDYISVKSTTAINGVFVLLVFLRHVIQYISLDGVFDQPFKTFNSALGQMIVVTFLFYSGYGIMESIKKKGKTYVASIPYKRFLKVFYHFVLALGLFTITNLCLGRHFGLKTYLLALTGWTSIGNSNWYVTAILALYLFTFFAFSLSGKHHYIGATIVSILTVIAIYILIRVERPNYCYNTTMLYACGIWYSLLREKLEKILLKNDLIYLLILAFVVPTYFYTSQRNVSEIEWHTVWSMLFMTLVLLISMKIKVGNKALEWLGSHVFSIYILQRIPMLVLQKIGFNATHKYAFVVISFVATISMSYIFDCVTDKLDKLIYHQKSQGK